MVDVFDEDRTYVLGDPELDLIGSRERLAQWRYQCKGPPYYKLGRKILYRRSAVLDWLEEQETIGQRRGRRGARR